MNHGWRIGRMPPTQHCIGFPNITGASGRRFLDTGIVLDQHSAPVILSDLFIAEAAKEFGFVSLGEALQMQQKYDELVADHNRALERIAELEKFKEAVETVSGWKKKALAEASK